MTPNQKFTIAGLFIGVLAVLGGVYLGLSHSTPAPTQKFGDTTIQPIYAPNTNTGFLCTGSSQLMLATSTNPGFLSISNDSANGIYLNLGYGAAVLHQGIYLPGSTTIQFNQTNFYAGQISCIATGNASTTISETK